MAASAASKPHRLRKHVLKQLVFFEAKSSVQETTFTKMPLVEEGKTAPTLSSG